VRAAFLASCLSFGIALSGLAAAKEPEPGAEAPGPAAEQPEASATEAAPVKADAPEGGAAKGGKEPADERFGHGLQFGLRAGLTGGYRVIFRYDRSPYCRVPEAGKADKDQQKFCGGGAPLALDLALSFGVFDFLEPYAWARFGLKGEASTNTNGVTAFGAGARIYTMSDSRFKIFVEPAIGVELEGGGGNPAWTFSDGSKPDYKSDFLFHLGVGPQYDFARAVGVYVNAGITTGVLRYIHTQLELSGGVQVRVP
jgi:hypothetical protein